MRPAFRRILLILAFAVVVSAGALAIWLARTGDPVYAAYELVYSERFHRYDSIIAEVSRQRGLDPMVVKAVIWRESRFLPDKMGTEGERGLMQITDAAAREWVHGEKVASYAPNDLFDPKVNIEAGTWLLARAMHRYGSHDDPLTFALAEYNAGRSRVNKWIGETERDPREPGLDPGASLTGQQLLQAKIDIPRTRSYIETVQNRVQFYHQRGRL